jgi:hypothetical protein
MGTLDSSLNLSSVFPSTPLPVDINALNNTGTRQFHSGSTGDDVYSLTDEMVFDTIIDGGGVDTISAENYADGQVRIDLRQNKRSTAFETASLSSLHISNQTFIENAIGGSFSDLIVGSPFAATMCWSVAVTTIATCSTLATDPTRSLNWENTVSIHSKSKVRLAWIHWQTTSRLNESTMTCWCDWSWTAYRIEPTIKS